MLEIILMILGYLFIGIIAIAIVNYGTIDTIDFEYAYVLGLRAILWLPSFIGVLLGILVQLIVVCHYEVCRYINKWIDR